MRLPSAGEPERLLREPFLFSPPPHIVLIGAPS